MRAENSPVGLSLLSECGCDGQYEELYAALEEFFGKLRYKLEYSDDEQLLAVRRIGAAGHEITL